MSAIHKRCLLPDLDSHTPRIVIEWLYQWYGTTKNFRQFQEWAVQPCPSIDWDLLEQQPVSYLAWFINPKVTWTGKGLKNQWKKYRSSWETLAITPEYGAPAQEYRTELGLLYCYLRNKELPLSYETSFEEMVKMAEWLTLPIDQLRNLCFNAVFQSSRMKMVTFLLKDHEPISETSFSPPDYFFLTNQIENFYDLKYLQRTYRPLSNLGAIICAALNFRLDLLWSKDPSLDYYRLRDLGTKNFHFQDSYLDEIYHRNGRFFSLDFTFRPFYSPLYYPNGLESILIQYGLNPESSYEDLVDESTADTFYSGPLPFHHEKVTSVLWEETATLPYGELFYYGSITGDLQPLSLNEIYTNMMVTKNFSNPLGNGNYRDTAILRLKELLKVPPSFLPLNPSTSKLYQRTLDQIETIINWNKDDPKIVKQIERWKKNPAIQQFWEEVTKLGFFMRGWKGPSHPWPVKTMQTQSTPSDFDSLEANVQQQLVIVMEYFDKYPKLKTFPLVLYKRDRYEKATSSEEGLTIYDRLKIVAQSDSLNSCIRMSSYWILSTVHKYLLMFDQVPSFSIRELDYIS